MLALSTISNVCTGRHVRSRRTGSMRCVLALAVGVTRRALTGTSCPDYPFPEPLLRFLLPRLSLSARRL